MGAKQYCWSPPLADGLLRKAHGRGWRFLAVGGLVLAVGTWLTGSGINDGLLTFQPQNGERRSEERMKGTDKFLIAIVAGVVILVGAVLAVALLRPNQPTYQPDDTPEGVAHNYLLALELEEYERAYGYLSPTLPGYPANAEKFVSNVEGERWSFGYYDDDVSLAVDAVSVTGDRAKVVVRRTVFNRGGLFDSGQYSTTFDMTLRSEDGMWKIADSDRYWASCWESSKGCR